jgi:predicted TIM-barrel fold metal-dependent hydrolase
MSFPIIDSHVHVFPNWVGDWMEKWTPDAAQGVALGTLELLRRRARDWLGPVSSQLHRVQTAIRHVPAPARGVLDGLTAITPLGLAVESTAADLEAVMEKNRVDYALVIASPPHCTNEFLLQVCRDNPRLLPIVNIPKGTERPGTVLKELAKLGAKAVKIHPAMDGEGYDSARYQAVLQAADELGLPLILHTGCIHSRILYRAPEQGDVRNFEPWFDAYPDLRFVLAHTNFHDPGAALDLAEKYGNLAVETSWQPSEVIGESVRRLGAERVLFGSDWPLLGNNVSVGLSRIREAVDSSFITEAQAELVYGGNALKLFGIDPYGA